MASALQHEILDLRHYSAEQLRPVLMQEGRVWNERLHWDFRASADLLLQYLDTHVLPGYVAVERGEVAGYVFCVYEENKGVIGEVFAVRGRSSEPAAALDVENRLLEFQIELLQNSPGVDRIESQLLLHPHASHRAVFDGAGFTTYRRLFMVRDLRDGNRGGNSGKGPAAAAEVPNLPAGLVMREWQESDLPAAGRLIAAAYEHQLDSTINDQYRTVAGSLRFLHNIVRFPGCGAFDATASFVIAAPGSDQLAGLLLSSRVRPDVGHITQLCVAAQYRGRGLAKTMIQTCAARLCSRGINLLTLTVTEGNDGAILLYKATGFVERHSFDAMVWQRGT